MPLKSIKYFLKGIVKRVWIWIPSFLLDPFDIINKYFHPVEPINMPSEWFPWVFCGLIFWASFLTFHELNSKLLYKKEDKQLKILPGKVRKLCFDGDDNFIIWIIESMNFINIDDLKSVEIISIQLELELKTKKLKLYPLHKKEKEKLGLRSKTALPGGFDPFEHKNLQPCDSFGLSLIFLEEGDVFSQKTKLKLSIKDSTDKLHEIEYGEI